MINMGMMNCECCMIIRNSIIELTCDNYSCWTDTGEGVFWGFAASVISIFIVRYRNQLVHILGMTFLFRLI